MPSSKVVASASDPLRPAAADALAAWTDRVRAERAQVERIREEPESGDFYATTTGRFRADPRRRDDPALDVLRSLARPGETWLDIGAGAGRYALPLALAVGEAGYVVAIDPSPGMLAALREGMAEHDIINIEAIQGRWPDELPDGAGAPHAGAPRAPAAPRAAASLIANVGYDIEAIGPFLDGLEAATERLCVAIMAERAPSSAVDALWPAVVGEPRLPLPALAEFEALLLARGRLFEARLVERQPPAFVSFDDALAFVRRQLWVKPGSDRDRRLLETLPAHLEEHDGGFVLPGAPRRSGLVWWAPRQPAA